jgi:antitoxin component YwqK of YwqJK toxin-antitoxin module
MTKETKKEYYSNGQLLSEENFENGERNGADHNRESEPNYPGLPADVDAHFGKELSITKPSAGLTPEEVSLWIEDFLSTDIEIHEHHKIAAKIKAYGDQRVSDFKAWNWSSIKE